MSLTSVVTLSMISRKHAGYGRHSDKQKIAEAFHLKAGVSEVDFMPDTDVTPGTMQPVVFSNDEGERDIELMYWGFNFPRRFTVNTRADTIIKPGLWKNSFEDRRCVVPADSMAVFSRF
jgi:putative SOS response-associated peptidase YedK